MIFLERTVGDWIRDAGAEEEDDLRLVAALSSELLGWNWGSERQASLDRMWLSIDPEYYSCVTMAPVVKLLEPIHPRLPATFYGLFVGAAGKVLGVYDWREADDHYDMHEEYYAEMAADAEAHGGDFPFPNRPLDEVLPALLRKPLSDRSLRRLMGQMDSWPRRILQGALELRAAAAAAPGWELTPEMEEELGVDWMSPNPSLVVCMERGDVIERFFDETNDARAQYGEPFAPVLALHFDARDDAQILAAHRGFMAGLRVAALTAALLKDLPTGDPQSLAEILSHSEDT